MSLAGARVGDSGPGVCMGRAERRGRQAGAECKSENPAHSPEHTGVGSCPKTPREASTSWAHTGPRDPFNSLPQGCLHMNQTRARKWVPGHSVF